MVCELFYNLEFFITDLNSNIYMNWPFGKLSFQWYHNSKEIKFIFTVLCNGSMNAWCFAFMYWNRAPIGVTYTFIFIYWDRFCCVVIDSGESEASTAAPSQLILFTVGKEALLNHALNSLACAHTTVVLPSSSFNFSVSLDVFSFTRRLTLKGFFCSENKCFDISFLYINIFYIIFN